MRIVTAFWLVCATACAANNAAPQAAPSSLQVDPLGEVIAIPPGSCLGLDDHFAMSTDAVRQLLMNMAETNTRHALELARCDGAKRIAEVHARAAELAAEHNSWLARWGLPLGFGAGVFITALAGAIFLLGGK